MFPFKIVNERPDIVQKRPDNCAKETSIRHQRDKVRTEKEVRHRSLIYTIHYILFAYHTLYDIAYNPAPSAGQSQNGGSGAISLITLYHTLHTIQLDNVKKEEAVRYEALDINRALLSY